MRAQDANRRRHPPSDISRDTLNARPLSIGSPKLTPPVPPPPPPRSMMQSTSVCDLSSSHMWNPGMHQVTFNFKPDVTSESSTNSHVALTWKLQTKIRTNFVILIASTSRTSGYLNLQIQELSFVD